MMAEMEGSSHDETDDMEILGTLLEDEVVSNGSKDSEETREKNEAVPSKMEKKPKNLKRSLKLTDIFGVQDEPVKESVIHTGDTDSSEDEDNKYFDQQHLNDYGKSVKMLINNEAECKMSYHPSSSTGKSGLSKTWKEKGQLAAPVKTGEGLKFDPICGIRVINPVVSSVAFEDKLVGRKLVMLSYIQNHINNGDLDADWVTVGVIVQKSNVQKSQKGSQYSILTLSDLKIGLKKVSLFLFSGSFKAHWKHPLGTIIGILNPSVLNNRDSSTIATLSVDNAQKIMVIGTSKDFGYCKSWKKNGEKCTSFVNKGNCEYCVYHVQKEYKQFSQRSELQSPTGGGLQNLQNKVLGKNEVFYGGKSFVATKKVGKNHKRDELRLRKLSDVFDSPKLESYFDSSPSTSKGLSDSHKLKDAERLNKLMGSSSCSQSPFDAKASPSVSKSEGSSRGKVVLGNLRKMENKDHATPSQIMLHSLTFSQAFLSPKLGRGAGEVVDLDCGVNRSQKTRAKIQAVEWIKKNGPLEKSNPNAVRKESKAIAVKRKREGEDAGSASMSQNASPNVPGKNERNILASKFSAEKIKELMEKSSKHSDLLEIADLEAEDKYFNHLEKKEQMEEKMLHTYKLECKAVRCLKCKYLAFSASDLCKLEGHPTKVVNAVKRFFKCHDCGQRTISLELFPVMPCKLCGGAHWERSSMMKEKKGPILPNEVLSIRGHEEKYIGAANTEGNLNLLVPD